MWDLLNKLRSLPEESRKKAALVIAAGLTFAIVLPWFIIATFDGATKNAKIQNPADMLSPFAALKGSFSEVGGQVQQGMSSVVSLAKTAMVLKNASSSPEAATTTPKELFNFNAATTSPLNANFSTTTAI